jgi:hypothetical protein
MESGDVPDHSNAPSSRHMLNVMAVGAVSTPSSFRKAMKLCWGYQSERSITGWFGAPTVGCCVHHDETCVNGCLPLPILPQYGIRASSQAVLCFIQVYFMTTVLEGVESTDSGNSATDNGNSLPQGRALE